MVGVALVDVVPSIAHTGDLGSVVELTEENFLELFGGGARDDASGVHVGVASASETEIDDADDFVVVIE